MSFVSLRGAAAALAMTAACGSAHAFSATGNYDVTFTGPTGDQTQLCVTLASQSKSAPYRDVGSATFYSNGSAIAAGTYVVFQKTIAVVVETPDASQYITASGAFSAGQAFNTAVIDFTNNTSILSTATFQYRRSTATCANPSS